MQIQDIEKERLPIGCGILEPEITQLSEQQWSVDPVHCAAQLREILKLKGRLTPSLLA